MWHDVRTAARSLLPLGVALVAAGVGVVAPAGPSYAASSTAGPDYEMPFPCGDSWYGSSRANHSPSSLSIDWNRTDDYGDMVVAPARSGRRPRCAGTCSSPPTPARPPSARW